MQQVSQFGFIEFPQWRRTFATQIFRQRLRHFAPKPKTEFAQRCIDHFTQRQQRRPTRPGSFIVPDDVKDDIFECRISIVCMCPPTVGPDIHFDVSALSRAVTKLNDGAAKVRPAFYTSKAGMQHSDLLAIASLQLLAEQPLMLPNGLQ